MVTLRSLLTRRKQRVAFLLVGCVLAYSVVFIALSPFYGSTYVVFALLPIILAAGLFGMRAAGLASVAAIALTLALAALHGAETFFWLLVAGWPVFGITLVIAVFVGYLRDLQRTREQDLLNLQRIQSRLQTLNQINQSIVIGGTPAMLGRVVVEQLCALLDCDRAAIFVYDPNYSQTMRVLQDYSRAHGHITQTSGAEADVGQIFRLPGDRVSGCPLKISTDGDACATVCGVEMRSYISEPLTARSTVIGVLSLCSVNPDHFQAEQLEIVREIAAQLAVAIDNAQLYASQQRYVAELEGLRVATLQLTASLDREHVLGTILQYALDLMHADNAHIFLYDGEQLTFGAALWGGSLQGSPLAEPRPDGMTMRVARTKARMVVDDVAAHTIYSGYDFKGAIVGMPLLVSGSVEGVMSVAFDAPHHFNAHELRVLELYADHAALAIFNTRLVERIRDQNEALEERVIERTAALMDVNQSVEAILDNSSDAILLLSAQTGAVERMNATAFNWVGLESGDVQSSWRTFTAAENQAALSACFARVVATGEPQRQEAFIHTASGEGLYVDVAMSLDRSENRPSRVICSLRDVTARKLALSANEQLVEGLRAVVSGAYELLSCPTVDSLYHQAITTARSRLGLERCGLFVPHDENFWGTYGTNAAGEVIDESNNFFSMTDPEWAVRLEKLRRSSSQWITVEQELIEWRDGAQRTFGVQGWVVITPLRTPQGLVGIFINDSGSSGNPLDPTLQELVYLYASLLAHILMRRQLEEDLRLALRKERELNELKSRFVSMVSHEFRTPLTVIQSSSDMLKYYSARMTDEQRGQKLEIIQEQIHHLTGLLEDILAISRAESVGLELNLAPLDLQSLCLSIVSEFESTAHKRRLHLKTIGQPRRVPLDPKLMRQAISNLVSNAIKYSPSSAPVELELVYTPTLVTLSVTDYGIGIPANERERIFEIFHRAANVESVTGTGLGLAIVRHVVDLHDGRIDLSSEVGQGTTFRISLPAGD